MRKPLLMLVLAAALNGLTACASAPSADLGSAPGVKEGSTPSKGSNLIIKDFADRSITFPSAPQKIVALANGEMDIVYALGGTLVGRPTATVPAALQAAQSVEQVGSTHGLDLEKIALLSPDVVLGNHPLNTKDIPGVEGVGSKMVLTSANSIDDIKKQIGLFGQLLQKEDKAKELTQAIDQKLQELKTTPSTAKTRVLMVYGAPGTYMAALNNSLSGDILVSAGGENIAADYPKLDNYPQYAQMNTEKMMKSNPQLIVIMTHGSPEKVKDGFMKEMQQNAAWSSLDAVKNNHIEILPADLFGTNPGTKVVEALDLMSKRLQAAK
ncbi:ABC transporter substrate-binding protein [Paenibacillus sp. FSL H7-0331]|uniref:ABC transporter substrate-binding protein n=1 Tax=Paenibacillus sp. FSL H7-0331 TaxID=1920421 RepID=UPI00096CD804|nr:ABC transporter substrate-binding protein [Paenibacillus sp. FSL H7-0331]OMF14701.1 iron-hydroxamate ABC transporter substrate-binding protein [Paenibacillus sp. FSL H7-0331]